MKRLLAFIPIVFIVLLACGRPKNVTYENNGLTKITDKGNIIVEGEATDQLRRTAIRDDKGVYYVMKNIWGGWPEGVKGKRVKANGRLLIIDSRKYLERANYLPGGPGIMYLLTDEKWEVVE